MEETGLTHRVDNGHRIPLRLKVAYSSFLAVLIPYYAWAYGPAKFLWFCDVALIVTLIGIWRESKLLISMQAVAIVLPQCIWVLDFMARGITDQYFFGFMTEYMFNADNPLFVRGLSLFHGWMPILLLYLVARLGFDRRAVTRQVGLCWTVLLACFLLIPGPDTGAGNVNYIFGWGTPPQPVTSPWLWMPFLMIAYPLLIYVPAHFLLDRFFGERSTETIIEPNAALL